MRVKSSQSRFICKTILLNKNKGRLYLVVTIRSIGTTSRGRLGLTSSALGAGAITQPWLTDHVDKEVLINGLQQIINASKNGKCTDSSNSQNY